MQERWSFVCGELATTYSGPGHAWYRVLSNTCLVLVSAAVVLYQIPLVALVPYQGRGISSLARCCLGPACTLRSARDNRLAVHCCAFSVDVVPSDMQMSLLPPLRLGVRK